MTPEPTNLQKAVKEVEEWIEVVQRRIKNTDHCEALKLEPHYPVMSWIKTVLLLAAKQLEALQRENEELKHGLLNYSAGFYGKLAAQKSNKCDSLTLQLAEKVKENEKLRELLKVCRSFFDSDGQTKALIDKALLPSTDEANFRR